MFLPFLITVDYNGTISVISSIMLVLIYSYMLCIRYKTPRSHNQSIYLVQLFSESILLWFSVYSLLNGIV